MSDNFTPLPTVVGASASNRKPLPKKTIFSALFSMLLIGAIGSGVFLVNNVQNQTTKAMSTDACVSAGGFVWGDPADANPTCPSNTTQSGTIDATVGVGGPSAGGTGGDTQVIKGSPGTGGNHICCVPNGTPGQTPPTNTPPTPPVLDTKICTVPQPVIKITCPQGCASQ